MAKMIFNPRPPLRRDVRAMQQITLDNMSLFAVYCEVHAVLLGAAPLSRPRASASNFGITALDAGLGGGADSWLGLDNDPLLDHLMKLVSQSAFEQLRTIERDFSGTMQTLHGLVANIDGLRPIFHAVATSPAVRERATHERVRKLAREFIARAETKTGLVAAENKTKENQ